MHFHLCTFYVKKEENLQMVLNITEKKFGKYGMKLNITKTRIISCGELDRKNG